MAEAKGAAEKAKEKVGKEMADLMPLSHPPEDELTEHAEREPDRVIPHKDSDGGDTPSGTALREVGAPDPKDAGSEDERVRGMKYRVAKYKKRWLG